MNNHPAAWRITEFPWRAACAWNRGRLPRPRRLIPDRSYMTARAAAGHALTYRPSPRPIARATCGGLSVRWGDNIEDIYRTALLTDYQPKETLRFRFAPLVAPVSVSRKPRRHRPLERDEQRLLRGGAEWRATAGALRLGRIRGMQSAFDNSRDALAKLGSDTAACSSR